MNFEKLSMYKKSSSTPTTSRTRVINFINNKNNINNNKSLVKVLV